MAERRERRIQEDVAMLKIGVHDFLNSRPILHSFRHGLVEQPFEMVLDTPANLAERFHEGGLDMALLPSIEYARTEGVVIVPPVCIASLGQVETVLLFSEKAIEDVESVCVDPKSRSSVAMLKILFKNRYNRDITISIIHEDNTEDILKDADAGLIIGDNAFDVDREKYVVHDLGQLWYEFAGRPFVHAVMVAKENKNIDAAVAAIRESLDLGLTHLELIAHEETTNHREQDQVYDYLTKRIRYLLGKEEIDGLSHFLALAKKEGLCQNDELNFYRGGK